mmetsp:Transcript_34568/g.33771  ORF Transcript_34568/g.33771 Transcript_34568/m.33771 type:complete len:127 (+) Transcript_34568:488-868(+)
MEKEISFKEKMMYGELEGEFKPIKRNLFEEEFQKPSLSLQSTWSKEVEIEKLHEIQEYVAAIRREQLLFNKRTSDKDNPENSKGEIGNAIALDFEVFDRVSIKYGYAKEEVLERLQENGMSLEVRR